MLEWPSSVSCCSSQVLVSWIIISVTYLIAEKGANHMLRTAVIIFMFVASISSSLADMRADSLLLTSARSKNIQMIELAISLDGDVNVTDEIGRTPLILASFHGYIPVMELLLERKAQIKARDSMGRTALMWAALAGKIEAVDPLLARGADTLALDKKGNSAVEWALREGHQELSNVLRVRAKN